MEPDNERDARLTALFKPVDPSLVRERKGAGGRHLSYVEWHEKLRRVAEVDPAFSWTSVKVEWRDAWMPPADAPRKPNGDLAEGWSPRPPGWGAQGTLTVLGIARIGRGYSVAKTAGEDDGSKDAISDAFSRACAMFGVGLELYSKDETRREPAPAFPSRPAAPAPAPVAEEAVDAPAPDRRFARPSRPTAPAIDGTPIGKKRAAAFVCAGQALEHLTPLGLTEQEFWHGVRARYRVASRADMNSDQWDDLLHAVRPIGNPKDAATFLDRFGDWSTPLGIPRHTEGVRR